MLKAETTGSYGAPWAGNDGCESRGPSQPSSRVDRPLDLIHLAKQTFGDRRLEAELLRLFLRQAEQIARMLGDAPGDRVIGQTDVELLHLLAGSARAVGATRVAVLASDGEGRLREGDMAARLDEVAREALCREVAAVSRFIAELLDQG